MYSEKKETFYLAYRIPDCPSCDDELKHLQKINKNNQYTIFEINCNSPDRNLLCDKYDVMQVPTLHAFNHRLAKPRVPQTF